MTRKTAAQFWDEWVVGKTRGRPHVCHPFNIQLNRAWDFAEAYAAYALASHAPDEERRYERERARNADFNSRNGY